MKVSVKSKTPNKSNEVIESVTLRDNEQMEMKQNNEMLTKFNKLFNGMNVFVKSKTSNKSNVVIVKV